MCPIRQYFECYHFRAGNLSTYSIERLRLIRKLIDTHRKTCPDCRDMLRSNYNVAPGRALRREFKGRKTKGG